MTLRLRFAVEVEFDSIDTAKAYGVALGCALGTIAENALATSQAPAPRIERGRIEVTQVFPVVSHDG